MALILSACTGTETTTPAPEPTSTTSPPQATGTTGTTRGEGTTSAPAPSTTSTVVEAPPTTDAALTPRPPTPSQQEGPFYPVELPPDSDADLTQVEGTAQTALGSVLLLDGVLVATSGEPIAGAVIEIWQTDHQGIYLHPGDPGLPRRDQSFQGYGQAVTASDGTWAFRTIDPGYYEPRPRHIHFKVLIDGSEHLTSQIYFADDPQAAGADERLVATIAPGVDEGGNQVLLAQHTVVLDL